VILALAVTGLLGDGAHGSVVQISFGFFWLAVLGAMSLPAGVQRRAVGLIHRRRRLVSRRILAAGDPLVAVRQAALAAGGGVYLGAGRDGVACHSRPERAVLLVGPPRSGKTSAVIVPAVLAHTGPVVATSTKPDVARATCMARSRSGRTWVFDPTGTGGATGGVGEVLRWSPVTASGSWDAALLVARAMTVSVGSGTTDRSHWATRAQALLASLLHAAAIHGRAMDTVVDWVLRHRLDDAGVLLEDERCAKLAFWSLVGVFHTEARERSSIFSAAADALQAYASESALAATRDPNFDANEFVRSRDTVYIHAPAEEQAAAAPLVCGLLSEIRRAAYAAHAAGRLRRGRALFALDEVANIAPLEELPQIASEAGGQGLILLTALQDLSQARTRWGAQADGFLTLFGTKLILPGVADTRTLESVSQMLGEYDRHVISSTRPETRLWDIVVNHRQPSPATATYSTQRTRVLSPGEVANIPAGRALRLDGACWQLLTLTPAHETEPWHTLTQP